MGQQSRRTHTHIKLNYLSLFARSRSSSLSWQWRMNVTRSQTILWWCIHLVLDARFHVKKLVSCERLCVCSLESFDAYLFFSLSLARSAFRFCLFCLLAFFCSASIFVFAPFAKNNWKRTKPNDFYSLSFILIPKILPPLNSYIVVSLQWPLSYELNK